LDRLVGCCLSTSFSWDERSRKKPGSFLLAKAIAFSPNVEHVAVVEKTVQNGGGHDRVTEDLTPFGESLVRRQDDAASFIARGDQREEGGGGHSVVRPDAELVDDQHFGRQVDTQPTVQSVLDLRSAKVFQEFMGSDQVDSVAVLNGRDAQP